jgi:hypothetical protein
MKYLYLIFLLIPVFAKAQLEKVPLKDGQILFEKIILLDSVNDKNIVFNSAKSALIRNTNYKYTKVDEDRTSGNITTEITFTFLQNSVFGPWEFNAKSNLSIDVKENRFRIRLYNNTASFMLMNRLVEYEFNKTYAIQKDAIEKGNYKIKKDAVTPWNDKLLTILNAFGELVKDGVKDDF